MAFSLFLFYAGSITAQERANRATLIGVKLGATYANMNFNKGYPPPATPVPTSWRGGVAAGLMLNITLSDRFSLQPEYMLLTNSTTRNDSAITYHLAYLSLPVLLKYNVVPGLYISGGAQFDLLISAKKKAAATTTITHDTEERNIGITGGLEYFIRGNVSLSARYTQGLNHIGIGQRSSVQEYKSQHVLITAGFYF